MNNWQIKKISQVAIINPPRPKFKEWDLEREVDFLPMSVLATNAPNPFPAEKKKVKEVLKGYTYFQSDDILLAKITPCFENGKSGIFKRTPIGIGFGSTEFIVIRVDKSKALPLWVWLFVFSSRFRQIGKLQMRGSAGQRRLPVNFVENYQIPIPPLYIQQNIIEKLNTIRKLQELNNKEIEKAEELFNSLLTSLLKPKQGWQTKKLGEICKIIGGGTPSRVESSYWDGHIPWITMEDLQNGLYIYDSKQKITEVGLNNSNAQLVPKDSVILSCTALVGNVAINKVPITTNQQFNSFVCGKDIIPEFLAFSLMSNKSLIKRLGGLATVRFINKKVISNLSIQFPSILIQQQIVERLDEIRDYLSNLKKEKEKLSELFESTLNMAMKGELVS